MTSRCRTTSGFWARFPGPGVRPTESARGEAFGRRKAVLSSVSGNWSPSCCRVTGPRLELLHSGSRRQSSSRPYGNCSPRAFFRSRLPRGRQSTQLVPLSVDLSDDPVLFQDARPDVLLLSQDPCCPPSPTFWAGAVRLLLLCCL